MAGAIVGGNVELIFEDLVYGSALDGESVALVRSLHYTHFTTLRLEIEYSIV